MTVYVYIIVRLASTSIADVTYRSNFLAYFEGKCYSFQVYVLIGKSGKTKLLCLQYSKFTDI